MAIFEAVHGSAPKYAGKNVINPTALILSSVLMLKHLGEAEAAQQIEDAVFVTLEEGKAVTLDVARQSGNVEASTSTSGFADAVIENLGRAPAHALPHQGRDPGQRAGAARRAGSRDRSIRPTRSCWEWTSTPRWTAIRSRWAGCSTRLPGPSSSCS